MINLDGTKLQYHIARVNDLLDGKRVAPITVDMALTKACTYKCIYCFAQLQKQECFKQMSIQQIKGLFDDFVTIDVKAVSLVSDGESTCHPDWAEAIVYGKSRGLDMALGTNGYLMNQNQLEMVLPSLTYLRFNISSASPANYCKYHGVGMKEYSAVIQNIVAAVHFKRAWKLGVTIGLQMVFMPEMIDDVLPLARLGRVLGVDYLVIKHCSDDEKNTLGLKYEMNERIMLALTDAEKESSGKYQVKVKWSKILEARKYKSCYGSPLMLQISGSGLIAPCGSFFNDKYKKYWIGNLHDKQFIDIFHSRRYWEVMAMLRSESFDARKDCATNCLQEKVNIYLDQLINGGVEHVNFV